MAATIPQVGFQAVALGMASFNASAMTVTRQMENMSRQAYYLQRTTQSAFSGVEASTTNMLSTLLRASSLAAGALAAVGLAAETMASRYQRDMTFVEVVSGATAQQMQILSNAQLELARTSTQSAGDLAKASTELVRAGLSVTQVSSGALKAVNDMVVASNGAIKVSEAAVIAATAVNQFHTTAEAAANATIGAYTRMIGGVSEFEEALRSVGPVAARQGLSIQEFGAAVATMGQQMTSGTEIGASLRLMFQRLEAPSKTAFQMQERYGISLYDSTGKARPFVDVLASLQQQFGRAAVESGKITQAERDHALGVLFSSRAVKGLSVLLDEGTEAYSRNLDAINKTKAADIANAMLTPTSAKAVEAAHAIQDLALAFGAGLDPAVNTALGAVLAWLQSIDLDKIGAFGQAVGDKLYNAFRNTGTIVQQVLIPVMQDLWRVLAAGAVVLVVAQLLELGAAALGMAASVGAGARLFVLAMMAMSQGIVVPSPPLLRLTQQVLIFTGTLVASVVTTVAQMAIWVGSQIIATTAALAGWVTLQGGVLQAVGTMIAAAVLWAAQSAAAVVRMIPSLLLLGLYYSQVAAAAVASAVLQATAWVSVALPAVVSAIGAMLIAISPFLLGIAAIGGAAALLVIAWQHNWGDIQGIVQKAVSFILQKLNDFLDMLSQLPIIGDAIGGARAALGSFFQSVPGWVSTAGDAIGSFVHDALASFGELRNLKMPKLEDYTKELEAAKTQQQGLIDAAKAASQAAAPSVGGPGTEPGAFDQFAPADNAKKKIEEVAKKIENTWKEFDREVERDTENTTRAIQDAWDRANQEIDDKTKQTATDVQKAIEDTNRRLGELSSERDIKSDQEARRKALDDTLKDEAEARKEAREREDVEHQRELEDAASVQDKERQLVESTERAKYEAKKRARDRAREDAQHAYEEEQRDADNALRAQQTAESKQLSEQHTEREKALRDDETAEDESLKRRLTSEEEAYKAGLDAQKDALQRRHDQLTEELDKEVTAEKDALKASQADREGALRSQFDQEERARKDQEELARITQEDAVKRAEAEAKYNDELSKGVKASIAQARLDAELTKISTSTGGKRSELSQRERGAQTDLDARLAQERRVQTLREQFAQEDAALNAQTEAKKKSQRELFTQESQALTLASENQIAAMREQHEAAVTRVKLGYEQRFNEQKVAFDKESLDLEARHNKETQDLKEQQYNDALARKRRLETEDRARDKADQEELDKWKATQDLTYLKTKRDAEETERLRRIARDKEDETFRLGQQQRTNDLQRTFEQEDYNRRVKVINDERDARINTLNQTLADETAKIQAHTDEETGRLQHALDDRVKDVRQRYTDKITELADEAHGELQSLADSFMDHIEERLTGLLDTARELNQTLSDAFSKNPGGGATQSSASSNTTASVQEERNQYYWAQRGFYKGNGATDEEADQQANEDAIKKYGFRYGGIVNGPTWGMLGEAGSEVVAPLRRLPELLGLQRRGVYDLASLVDTSVMVAEAMYSRGVGASSTVTNTYEYKVDAHYGQVQEHGSVVRDLSALVAMTRR